MSTKYIWVQLNGPPWGFRMKEENKGGGVSLVVSRVNSKGREQGLKEGDRVLSVNGQPTAEMTHADAQRVIRESSSGIELQIERNTGNPETNGFSTAQNGNMAEVQFIETRLNALDEEANHAGSWSTDSTSTGSTTIHISSLNSDDTSASDSVWSPSTKRANLRLNCNLQSQNEAPVQIRSETPPKAANTKEENNEEDKSPVWQPFGAPYEGPPQFRPIRLGLSQTKMSTTTTLSHNDVPKENETDSISLAKPESPNPPSTEQERTTSPTVAKPLSESSGETPSTNTAPTIFTKTGWGSHLPPSQSPTITLLQKAREGKITKGAVHIEEKPETTPIPKNAVLIDQKVTVEGDKVHTDSYYAVPTLTTESKVHTLPAPPKYDGIGPTEYGIPVGLRTGVKEEYASDWYKTMYKSLHRSKFPDPTKTVHLGGYMSEPEYDRKDKIKSKYTTDYRRKPEKSVSYSTEAYSDQPRVNAEANVVRHNTKEVYRVEPRSIAEYEPGKSSLAEKEFQKFWSDFWDSMDDLHEHLGSSPRSPRYHQQGLNRRWPNVLLSDGYDSDSTLIRKTGRIPEVDPDQQKAWYKEIQKGGEIPLTGLRKSAPERPAAPTHKYEETEVNIHYRSPVRHLEKEYIDEEELRKIQEDAMRKLYEEERRKKHQQELAEIEMRRHSDFFTPSQKSPIPLNRYENPFESNYSNLTPHGFSRGPPPKTMARVLYPFTAQTTRELSLNKGDIVYISKQIDKNWYEGEHHGLVGIFPVTYVEIIPNEKANFQPRKAVEGEALVKYNFRAQTPQELSLFKGEKVVLMRRLDHNWFEGRLGAKKGIFPISYVEVLHEPGEFSGARTVSPKPPASPVFSSIINGSPPKTHEGPTFNTGLRPLQSKPPLQLEKSETKSSLTQSLHIDTYNEPIPYRALYAYKPQNDDELELREGDTVYVMEKCDDGWYVGTSLRTGLFGTFPGNYVERI